MLCASLGCVDFTSMPRCLVPQHVNNTSVLFVCFSYCKAVIGSKYRLIHTAIRLWEKHIHHARQVTKHAKDWIADTVSTAYDGAGLPPPGRVAAHSTRGVSTSWALFRGASMAEICDVASWSTPHTFARFYRLKVIDPSLPSVGTRVLEVARSRR